MCAGSGKTHTIIGADADYPAADAGAGVIERSARYLFERARRVSASPSENVSAA